MNDERLRFAVGNIITLISTGQATSAMTHIEALDREHLAPIRSNEFVSQAVMDQCVLLGAYLETARQYLANGDTRSAQQTLEPALGVMTNKQPRDNGASREENENSQAADISRR